MVERRLFTNKSYFSFGIHIFQSVLRIGIVIRITETIIIIFVMNYCDKYSIKQLIGEINTEGKDDVDALYRYLCPILLIGMFLTTDKII